MQNITTSNPFSQEFSDNPLLQLSPEKPVDFNRIIERKGKDFLPAMELYRDMAKKRIEKIKNNSQQPNFENTILALELADQELQECASIYYVLFSAECTEEIQKIAPEISSFLARFANDIYLDEELFYRIDQVYKEQKGVHNPEQKRLTEYYWKNFKRNGALLSKEDKEKLRRIDEELSQLSPKFSENLLKSLNDFELHITNKEDLKGLPETLIEQGEKNAKERNQEGWIFTLQFPEYLPFITYCENQELRKKMYLAFRTRALEENRDNRPIIKRILELRYERANLLGYQNHAEYILEERMAKNPTQVIEFLEELYTHVYGYAQKESEELKQWIEKEFKQKIQLQSWDFKFYSEKYKKFLYDLDQESLRPYFPLEQVVEGLFKVANRLYGLIFTEKKQVPVYHPEVKVYEVKDENHNFIGLFYFDLFPRKTKKSGAWMTTIREQGLFMETLVRPHVGIVCNFTKPTRTKPSLLTFEEVRTLFHEFGHALHGLLSKVTYRSLAGTNVYWDFVELPSQIMENWLKEKETLDLFARHYKTSEPIPEIIIKKIQDSERFQTAIPFLIQLGYGFLDIYYHVTKPFEIVDIIQFEKRIMKKTQLWEEPEETCISTGFSHIFAGGYSAGYYSYKWAEVLEADAFEYFKEKGIFNREIANRFRNFILEKGNTEDPMELYIQFRGRKPSIRALLKKSGLLSAS